MTANEVNSHLNLQIHISEKKEGLYTLKPIGSINTMTSRSLQKAIERICALKPNIILFDLESVGFINSKGLRVILKVYRVISAHGGRVVLMNFQPHIKEVFKIINALPEQRIFASWQEFDNYLAAVQNKYVDHDSIKESETETNNGMICAQIKDDRRTVIDSRMPL